MTNDANDHIGKLMERIIQWIDSWDDSIDTMVFSFGVCYVNIPYKGFPADFPFIQIWEINDANDCECLGTYHASCDTSDSQYRKIEKNH